MANEAGGPVANTVAAFADPPEKQATAVPVEPYVALVEQQVVGLLGSHPAAALVVAQIGVAESCLDN